MADHGQRGALPPPEAHRHGLPERTRARTGRDSATGWRRPTPTGASRSRAYRARLSRRSRPEGLRSRRRWPRRGLGRYGRKPALSRARCAHDPGRTKRDVDKTALTIRLGETGRQTWASTRENSLAAATRETMARENAPVSRCRPVATGSGNEGCRTRPRGRGMGGGASRRARGGVRPHGYSRGGARLEARRGHSRSRRTGRRGPDAGKAGSTPLPRSKAARA